MKSTRYSYKYSMCFLKSKCLIWLSNLRINCAKTFCSKNLQSRSKMPIYLMSEIMNHIWHPSGIWLVCNTSATYQANQSYRPLVLKMTFLIAQYCGLYSEVPLNHYAPISGYLETRETKLSEALYTCLSSYNKAAGQNLELVFFQDAVRHMARLSRVMVSS